MKGGHMNYYTIVGYQTVTDKKAGVIEIRNLTRSMVLFCGKKTVVFVSATYQQILENLFGKFTR